MPQEERPQSADAPSHFEPDPTTARLSNLVKLFTAAGIVLGVVGVLGLTTAAEPSDRGQGVIVEATSTTTRTPTPKPTAAPTTTKPDPRPLVGVTGIDTYGAGGCALLTDATVSCWDASKIANIEPGVVGATALAVNDTEACAIVAEGTVKCWSIGEPAVAKEGLSGAFAIDSSGSNTCVLVGAGAAKCWGDNGEGQLGDRTKDQRSGVVDVQGVYDATRIIAGMSPCAYGEVGTFCWGALSSGLPFVQIEPGFTPSSWGRGGGFDCELWLATLACRGSNPNGELGVDDASSSYGSPLGEPSDAVAVDAGDDFACAVRATGVITCWGGNSWGQLGLPNGEPARSLPIDVPGLPSMKTVSLEAAYACGLAADTTVWCWGVSTNGPEQVRFQP